MKSYDFMPVALWESRSIFNFEFVYILRWPDVGTMERQWERFLADPEWIEIKQQTASDIGQPVLRVTSRVLDAIDYSPIFVAPINRG